MALLDSKEAQLTYRQASNFYKDTVGFFEETTSGTKTSYNAGMSWRTANFEKGGGRVRFFFRLELDIFYMDKLIPSGVKVQILLRQSNSEFRIMSAPDAPKVKLRILHAKFHPFFVRLNPELALESEKLFEKNIALLPFTRCEPSYETLAAGAPSFKIQDAFQGEYMYYKYIDKCAISQVSN